MTPAKYLHAGTACVLVIIALIAGQNWFAGYRVALQHEEYLTQEIMQDALDELRVSALRIVASANEAALIVMAGGSQDGKDDERATAVTTEFQMIEDAKFASQNAVGILNTVPAGESYGVSLASVVDICRAFDELLARTDALVTMLHGRPGSGQLFEAKERQEGAEREVLGKIRAARGSLNAAIEARGLKLAADFKFMKSLNLAAGAAAATMLLCLSFYFGRRIQRMFARIEDQNTEIAAANGGLEAALGELKSLQRALIDKEKLSTLGRLTATVSHELRNPLAALRNTLFILRRQAGQSAEMASFIDRADRNVSRCDNIISDLLEYTRGGNLDAQPADLRQLLADAVRDTEAPEGVTFLLDLPAEPVMAEADAVRFPRAVINLIENAGQAVAAAKRPGEVRISCGRQAGGARIVIEDTGAGIPEAVRPKIFDALFTTKSFGAGLGLCITKNLVTQHGGTIDFETVLGSGTKFTIFLPAAAVLPDRAEAA